MFQHIGENDHVEGAIRQALKGVANSILDPWVSMALVGQGDIVGIKVYSHYIGAGFLGHIIGNSAVTAANVQHPLAGSHALYEEVMIMYMAVLGVDATSILDRHTTLQSVQPPIQPE